MTLLLAPGKLSPFARAADSEDDRGSDTRRQSSGQARFLGAQPVHAQLQQVESPAVFLRNQKVLFNGLRCKAEADARAILQKSLRYTYRSERTLAVNTSRTRRG